MTINFAAGYHQRILKGRTLSRRLPGHINKGVVAHQGPGLGVVEDVGHLRLLVCRIDRHADGPEMGEAHPDIEELWAIGQEQAYPVSMAYAQLLEQTTHPQTVIQELLVGYLVLLVTELPSLRS